MQPTPSTTLAVRGPVLARRIHGALQVSRARWTVLRELEPQALPVTYWFDAPAGQAAPDRSGQPGEDPRTAVRLQGRLRESTPEAGAAHFDVIHTLPPVPAGAGSVAVTTRVLDVASGTWEVTATPVVASGTGPTRGWRPLRLPGFGAGEARGQTTFTPLARALSPGVRLWAWPTLVILAAVSGLMVQAVLARTSGLPAGRLTWVSVLACVLGLAGAKAYYLATHRKESFKVTTAGMSVQGFVLASTATIVLGALLLRIPPGAVLDVTGPAVLTGMAIGRIGCLLGGCCVGRPTASRWGIWSSDRALGVRRIPVQLVEAAAAGTLAAVTAALATHPGHPGAVVFALGMAAYIAVRQILFPLRQLPRATRHGRPLALVTSATVLTGAVAVMAAALV